jgi:hypothetical protein
VFCFWQEIFDGIMQREVFFLFAKKTLQLNEMIGLLEAFVIC